MSTTMKAMSARPPVWVNSHIMILKSFQPQLQRIVVNNNLEGRPASVGAVNPWKFCLQETLHCGFSACWSRPGTSILALRIQLQRSATDKRCEHFHSSKLRQWSSNASNDTDLCYPDTASLEKQIEKVSSDAMSVDRLLRPRSLRPPVRRKIFWEEIRLSMQACNSEPLSKAKKSKTELLGR